MYVVITIVHIIACLFMIGVVLLQQGKGADMGAVFGGSSQTLFGSSGAGNFLTRMTTGMAVVFMVTSLTLAYGSARRVTSTIFDDAPLPATQSAPADMPVGGGAPPPAAPEGQPAPQAEPQAAAPAAGDVAAEAKDGATGVAGEAAVVAGEVRAGAENVAADVKAGAEAVVQELKEGEQAAAQKAEDAADAVVGGEVEEAPGETDPVPPAAP